LQNFYILLINFHEKNLLDPLSFLYAKKAALNHQNLYPFILNYSK
jgi:hypothetical protein